MNSEVAIWHFYQQNVKTHNELPSVEVVSWKWTCWKVHKHRTSLDTSDTPAKYPVNDVTLHKWEAIPLGPHQNDFQCFPFSWQLY